MGSIGLLSRCLLSLPLLLLTGDVVVVEGGGFVVSEMIPEVGSEYMLDCDGHGDLNSFFLHQRGEALVPGIHTSLGIEVFRNASVFFETITMEHEGTHLCLRNPGGGQPIGYPTSLRVRPSPPSDLWEEVYKTKFITGLLAALVIGTMFALGCLVHKYRWRVPVADTLPIVTSSAYINPAMTGDDNDSSCSTKM